MSPFTERTQAPPAPSAKPDASSESALESRFSSPSARASSADSLACDGQADTRSKSTCREASRTKGGKR